MVVLWLAQVSQGKVAGSIPTQTFLVWVPKLIGFPLSRGAKWPIKILHRFDMVV